MAIILSGIMSFIVYVFTFKLEVNTNDKTKAFVILGLLGLLCLFGLINSVT
jgi:hypothetical protein